MISIQLEGGKELEAKLKTLETKVSRKIVRKAVRAAQKPVITVAKSNALSMVGGNMGGLIAANIILRAVKKQRRGSYGMSLRLKSKSEGAPAEFVHVSKTGRPTYIPAAIEYGHGSNKEQCARPFMRSAADSTRTKVISILVQQLKAGIEKIAKGSGK